MSKEDAAKKNPLIFKNYFIQLILGMILVKRKYD